MKFLIIDDEDTAIRDLTMILTGIEPEATIESAHNAGAAFSLCQKNRYDVVFLDINMPGKSGLVFANELRELRPNINIIIVTAYPQYALDALKIYVSGYLLKPVMEEDVREALHNLRNPIVKRQEGLSVRCFGDFEVFYNGEPVRFHRSKTKEMLAYLIDRRGSVVSGAQLRALLWEDEPDDGDHHTNYFSQITHDIKNTLDECGCGDVLDISRNSYAVVPEKITCDYYRALENDPDFLSHYSGEYMSQYSWAEYRMRDDI